MRKAIITILLVAAATITFAQEEHKKDTCYWTHKGDIGLNISQSAFSNWVAGGQNALAWQGLFNYELHYAKDNFKWDNTLNTGLGYSYFDLTRKPIKTEDKLEFTSLAGLKANEHLDYSLELAFRSQFAPGYDYAVDSTLAISRFLAPAYITLGVGIQWVPNKHFSINFAPLTGRIVIVNDTAIARILDFEPIIDPNDPNIHYYNDKVRVEFGARAVVKFNYPLAQNIDFDTKLELFSNYLENPQFIDVDWQNAIIMKINSWLNCSINTHMIYDYDIHFPDKKDGSKVQFKEVLSLGILFKLR